MKYRYNGALSSVLKLLAVALLSTFLVACSSGTSDVLTAGGFDNENELEEEDGFDEGDSDGNGIPDDQEDADNNGIPEGKENALCKGLGASTQTDETSKNFTWSDNCELSANISFNGESYRTPFYNSLYVEGVQRVLYCSGAAGATSYDAFVDGFFGPGTDEAVRKFQQDQNDENTGLNVLVVDGIVGPNTWARLQSRVEAAYISTSEVALNQYEVYGVAPSAAAVAAGIDCSADKLFLGLVPNTVDPVSSWKLTDVRNGSGVKEFSIDTAN